MTIYWFSYCWTAGIFKDIQIQSVAKDIEKLAKDFICFSFHTERCKRLNLMPKRNKKAGGTCVGGAEKVAVVHCYVKSWL